MKNARLFKRFGISLVPAILTCICICGTRVLWIETVFKSYQSFTTIMCAYPLSLYLTAVVILCFDVLSTIKEKC